MKGKDNKTIEAKFRNKFTKHNERYCKVCDDMRSLIKDFVVMRGGFYMFETYQPYVITETFDPICISSQYCEARVYAIYIKDNGIYIYVDSTSDLIVTKESLLSEDVKENWYFFDWDSGFVFEQAVISIVCELTAN